MSVSQISPFRSFVDCARKTANEVATRQPLCGIHPSANFTSTRNMFILHTYRLTHPLLKNLLALKALHASHNSAQNGEIQFESTLSSLGSFVKNEKKEQDKIKAFNIK